jgi:hypothetical protein
VRESVPEVTDPDPQTVSRLLHDLRAGDRDAFDELLPLVYAELREIAARQRWEGDEKRSAGRLAFDASSSTTDIA